MQAGSLLTRTKKVERLVNHIKKKYFIGNLKNQKQLADYYNGIVTKMATKQKSNLIKLYFFSWKDIWGKRKMSEY